MTTPSTFSALKAGDQWIIVGDERIIGPQSGPNRWEARITITNGNGGWPTAEAAGEMAAWLKRVPPVALARVGVRRGQRVQPDSWLFPEAPLTSYPQRYEGRRRY